MSQKLFPVILNKETFENYKCTEDGKIWSEFAKRFLIGDFNGGYHRVNITINKKRKHYCVHKIVAFTFIENPNNYTIVNHINGNKKDNRVENLEWCTQKYNSEHAHKLGLVKKHTRAVHQLNLKGDILKKFYSITEASKTTKATASKIVEVCKGTRKTSGGYKWKYVEEKINTPKQLRLKTGNWKQWKDFPYKVSSDGQVYSFCTKIILNSSKRKDGYLCLHLSNGKSGSKKVLVHRLVAECYIDNPNNYPIVNHIDGNKSNNHFTNLEWCTYSHNSYHAYKTGLSKATFKKAVIQFNQKGKELKRYESVSEASKITNIEGCVISNTCHGRQNTGRGFIWKFVSEYRGEKIVLPKNKRYRSVCQLDDEGKILKIFKSVAEANRFFGKNGSHINSVCRGNRKKALGYAWKYND